jgi:hypothetical protein
MELHSYETLEEIVHMAKKLQRELKRKSYSNEPIYTNPMFICLEYGHTSYKYPIKKLISNNAHPEKMIVLMKSKKGCKKMMMMSLVRMELLYHYVIP